MAIRSSQSRLRESVIGHILVSCKVDAKIFRHCFSILATRGVIWGVERIPMPAPHA